ncbi:hypothetical protein FPOA_00251 [Fusarium poae]|uniref:BTB domain-containing protein n=1 Tax=Fusarium poae TaxID=36050 RepID=A0A1B8B0Q9_FUSPO|nr:hypothetical protein FPOA_00251 [Fusarium poae]
MKVIRHDIDPKGDLLIVLKRPNTLNLMPDPPIEHDSYRPPPPYYRRILVDPSQNDNIEIEFRVSSSKMIRSSAFFERMLGGPWKEAVQEATGSPQLRRVSATDWNTDALTIVLNIIHDRAGEEYVPQDPNNFLLVHIAAIVDYYHCHKCTHIEAAMWQWAQNVTFHPSGDILRRSEDTIMLSISYEIDPGGDIELVLNKPNNQEIVPLLQFTQDPPDIDLKPFDNSPCTGRYSVFQELYRTGVSPVDSEVRMRVSSRHLILASRTFQSMLEGPWSEGTSSPQSLRQIDASEWDAMAFAIVLDIIHGRHLEIPVNMSLGLVARVSTVVDYYQCHEALHVYRQSWLSENKEVKAPMDRLCSAALLCLYAGWVFSDKTTISNMARLTLLHSEGLAQIDTYDLPIGGILDNIENQRQHLITESLQLLDTLQGQLVKETSCPSEQEAQCTALTLGVLVRVKHKISSFSTPLEHPYDGYSLNSVLRTIANIEEPMALHSNNMKSRTPKWSKTSRPCSIGGRLKESIEGIQSEIWSFCMRDPLEKTSKEETRYRMNFGDTKLIDVWSGPLSTTNCSDTE